MDQTLLDKSLHRGEVILKPLQYLNYYLSVFGIAFFNISLVIFAWDQTERITNPNPATLTNKQILIITLIDILLAIALFMLLKSKLKLRKVVSKLGQTEIRNRIFNVAEQFGISLNELQKNFFEGDWVTFSQSRKVIIIVIESTLYLNCRITDGTVGGFSKHKKVMDAFSKAILEPNPLQNL